VPTELVKNEVRKSGDQELDSMLPLEACFAVKRQRTMIKVLVAVIVVVIFFFFPSFLGVLQRCSLPLPPNLLDRGGFALRS
jgi:hypothetical protein